MKDVDAKAQAAGDAVKKEYEAATRKAEQLVQDGKEEAQGLWGKIKGLFK